MYVGNSWLVIEDVSRVLCFCIMDRPRQIFARSQYVGALNDIAEYRRYIPKTGYITYT